MRKLEYHDLSRFVLENGTALVGVRQAYHLDGGINPARDNVVLVIHSLTSSADAAGDWWRKLIGPGKVLDTRRFAVLAPNLLGSCYGTTVEREDGSRESFELTTRDQAALIQQLVKALGIDSLALVTGGSVGGMVALEVAASFPGLSRSTVVFAAPAEHSAWGIAWNHAQRHAIELAGEKGLALAREFAMLSYRTEREFGVRFGRDKDGAGRYLAQTYLNHHGEKLVKRFSIESYLTLLNAMDSHDVGRGRGGIRAALRPSGDVLIGVGIKGDRLYSEDEVERWTELAGADYREINSVHGHDAFLIEEEQVGRILSEALLRAGLHSRETVAC